MQKYIQMTFQGPSPPFLDQSFAKFAHIQIVESTSFEYSPVKNLGNISNGKSAKNSPERKSAIFEHFTLYFGGLSSGWTYLSDPYLLPLGNQLQMSAVMPGSGYTGQTRIRST